jgi:hypothetical protein
MFYSFEWCTIFFLEFGRIIVYVFFPRNSYRVMIFLHYYVGFFVMFRERVFIAFIGYGLLLPFHSTRGLGGGTVPREPTFDPIYRESVPMYVVRLIVIDHSRVDVPVVSFFLLVYRQTFFTFDM